MTNMDITKDPQGTGCTLEDIQYALNFECTMRELETQLHNTDDPEVIAREMLVKAVEFYDGDWCGVVEADLEVGAWTPLWWYNRSTGGMTPTRFLELEDAAPMQRWATAMRQGTPICIEDAEDIKDIYPGEYSVYKRLNAQSVIAAPFWKNPSGFLLVRNPKRFKRYTSLLQMFAYVAVSTINEKKLLERSNQSFSPENIKRDTDVIINLFGQLSVYTSKGVLTESILNSPKLSRLLVYLVLHRDRAVPPRMIVDALWPDEEIENPGNKVKALAFRLQSAFSIISDYRLGVSTTNGYRLNPELNVMTDLDQFDRYRRDAQNMPSSSNSSDAKIELLKKAAALYRGSLFTTASGEHWLIPTEVSYRLKYNGVINELMRELSAIRSYSLIQEYAGMALLVDPRNADAYFWLITALNHLGSPEIAKSELNMAREMLERTEYQDLTNHLAEYVENRDSLIYCGG